MTTHDVVLCSPVRTAIGAYNGSLKTIPAPDLGAAVVRETLRRSGLDAASIGSVVMGNVIQAGNKMNPARQASIGGGVPVSVPAMTVNRVCGSGAQAIVTAAQQIATGEIDAAIAGGMENMDRAPYLMDGGRWGYRMGPAEIHDSMLRDGLDDAFSGKHSGWHTEDLVTQAQLTRAEQTLVAAFQRRPEGGQVRARDRCGRRRASRRSPSTRRRGPTRRSRCWPSSVQPSAKAGRSRPATRPASIVPQPR